MSDVRLTATNPEDSSVVPVSCNARGELMTVAPVIEKIPNDVEIEGDLTVTGTINGDSGGGSGLPPVGPDGSILAVVEGAPAWVGKSDLCAPPEPEGDQVIWTPGYTGMLEKPAQAIDANGNAAAAPSDWNQYIKNCSGWSAQPGNADVKDGMGRSIAPNESVTFSLQILEPSEVVLNVGVRGSVRKHPYNQGQVSIFGRLLDSSNATEIRSTITGNTLQDESESPIMGFFSYLITRPNKTLDIYMNASGDYTIDGCDVTVQWWYWESTANYLIRQEAEANARRLALRSAQYEVGSTTDIDLPR